MHEDIAALLQQLTFADTVEVGCVLQRLWSGYGSIVRYRLQGASVPSVIVKHVLPPSDRAHPRGWNTDLSHQRKLQSYTVEAAWYRGFASRCDRACRVPACLQVVQHEDEFLMVLEDLDPAGYSERKTVVAPSELKACLAWLAHFHAKFMGIAPVGLWESGCYWHLETRSDELQVLAGEDPELWALAGAIDAKLKASAYQTLVHGDAKLANFCFSQDGQSVAAVDFQYVGAGCGMKDLAYFIGSCLNEDDCEREEVHLLDLYFSALREALKQRGGDWDLDAIEADWRALYPVAWTDFHRFLKGWSPGHWKIHNYSERLARQVVAECQGHTI
jgi:hypothetical protein